MTIKIRSCHQLINKKKKKVAGNHKKKKKKLTQEMKIEEADLCEKTLARKQRTSPVRR